MIRVWFLVLFSLGIVLAARAELPARWWKGNLHTHTLWSDGDEFPEMVVEWYRLHNYQFLALSDHNILSRGDKWVGQAEVLKRVRGEPWRAAGHQPVDAVQKYVDRWGTNWVQMRAGAAPGELRIRLKPLDEFRSLFEEPERFLMIPAEELTHKARNGRQIHMGAINVLDVILPRNGDTVRDVMTRNLRAVEESARRNGREILVHVNHPNYKWGVTAEDLAAVINERFFEVWNGVDVDNDPGDLTHPSTDEIWDIANTLRIAGMRQPPLFAVASDDTHDYHGTKLRAVPGRAWVMVRASRLTAESLIHAMRAGDFYASTGVVLEDVAFVPETRTLSLRIQGGEGETFVTRFLGTRRGVRLQGKIRRDASGRVVDTTLDYRQPGGPQIGEVLREETGRSPSYRLTGDELYVRAVVVSSRSTVVPSTEYEFQRAWTQPVGW